MTALKYEQALGLNGRDFRRRTGVDPETFAKMEAVPHNREASNRRSGRPPALPVGAQLLLTLEFWREHRTFFYLGQAWGMHETTVLRTRGPSEGRAVAERALLPTWEEDPDGRWHGADGRRRGRERGAV